MLDTAIAHVLFYADPIEIAKITQARDEYITEAHEIAKLLKNASFVSVESVAATCQKVFASDLRWRKVAMNWRPFSPAICWLINHQDDWTL